MRTGILFINTGTAQEPTVEAVAAYLREFLMDPAIIGAPTFIRKRIVNNIVKSRPQQTLANYQEFWTPEGSPFILTSKRQTQLLEAKLQSCFDGNVQVALAMRYGSPSIAEGLRELQDAGCDTVVLFPVYPQQARTCTDTCLQKATEELNKLNAESGWNPKRLQVSHFYQLDSYRGALARQLSSHWSYKPGSKLLVSFHSTLLSHIKAGDPYEIQTQETALNLAQDAGIPLEDMVLCYQSRFDSRKWLGPFTEPTILKLAEEGVKDLAVICPIFVADNMETVLETNRDLRKKFLEAAGDGAQFTYIPALNDAPEFIDACAEAVCQVLKQ